MIPRSNARGVALEAVRRVVDDGGYSTLVIPSALRRSDLSDRDRAFATDLAYGTLRHLRSLDWAISQRASRPIDRMSPVALGALRLGAYQVLFTGVASHAAVGESVELASVRERGFVNAVLRRLAEDPPEWPPGPREEDVAVRTGLAPWMIRELRHVVGDDAEVAAAACAEHGRLSLRTNTCAIGVDAFEEALRAGGHVAVRSSLDRDCFLLEGGDPARLPGFAEGWFAVQDEASVCVVRALDPRPGERVLDACAAPGGKASFIACVVGEDGTVIAADNRAKRCDLIRNGARRLGVSPLILAQDATHPALRGPFDRVLVDAPCSGIGSARRRPELLWRPRADELSALARLQVAITASAADLLKPGGRLVYSVCTFPRAETDAAADAISRHRPGLVPDAVAGPDGVAERFRLWPHIHGCDGMFVAGFTKRR
ncbi:MAG: 16S rRNA (cytosine(967)-C(5))-methyltransferase RsmB [Actinomycetota bacterium]|nr:16S rRNA (cytosine(967)-C(5))-methyltransferase RsmB [Actinomycetota bacterium]